VKPKPLALGAWVKSWSFISSSPVGPDDPRGERCAIAT
jgi:hypothetical protein